MIYWLHSRVEISFLANIVAEWHQTDHATIVLNFFQSFASSGSFQVLCNVKVQRSTPGFITYAHIKLLDGLFRHLESKPHTIEGGRRRRISGSRAAPWECRWCRWWSRPKCRGGRSRSLPGWSLLGIWGDRQSSRRTELPLQPYCFPLHILC